MVVKSKVYRADVVGSMLRPAWLNAARQQMRSGKMSPGDFKVIEDRAVDEAIRIQETAGVDVVTDGEMRRDIFFDFFVSGTEGLTPGGGRIVKFEGAESDTSMEVEIPFSVTQKVQAKTCPGVAEFEYAQAQTDLPVKVTVPGPMMLPLGFWTASSKEAYPDSAELAHDSYEIVRGWIEELIEAGCKYIGVDVPDLAQAFVDQSNRTEHAGYLEMNEDDLLRLSSDLVGKLGDIPRPPDVTLGMHLCKGNGTRSWVAEGGYGAVADDVFPKISGFDTVHFEYDDARSGGFEPLEKLADDTVAVLGLVSTKWTEIEDADELRDRINQAAEYHPLDMLAIASQCGFASGAETAEERMITDDTQLTKLKLIADVAHSVW